jgi:outer membrane protease
MPLKRLMLFLIILPIITSSACAQQALQLESLRQSSPDESAGPSVADVAFSLDSGVMFGMLWEHLLVDPDGNGNYSNHLSRLDWQVNPLFYIGASGSIRFCPGFFMGFGVWTGIPAHIGYMEDRDWDWLTSSGDYQIYSRSENHLESSIFTDLNFGISVVEERNFIINAIAGLSFRQFSLSSHDTWVQDPPGNTPYLVSGRTIDFETNFTMCYLAGEMSWSPSSWLTLDFFLSISPFLTFLYDRDRHYSPPGYYQDLPFFGLTLSSTISISIHFNNVFDLRLKPYISGSPLFKGNTYVNGGLSTSMQGGSSVLLYGFSISIVFSFGRPVATPPATPPPQAETGLSP